MSRASIISRQLSRLNSMLASLREHPFYAERLADAPPALDTLEQITQLPLLTKQDILGDAPGGVAKIFHLPRTSYTRLHQTSGTRGWPLQVMDTPADWQWWMGCWNYVLDAARLSHRDTAMMAFSFGPFIGFWTAFDALVGRGVLVVPGGGLTSLARLRLIQDAKCNVLFCTPTYALHLAHVAAESGIDLVNGPVDRMVVAGEPGGSIPSIRSALRALWGAEIIDHAGASEIGAWGFGVPDGSGLQIIEPEFIAEFLVEDRVSGALREALPGETSELVLTNLGRHGGPLLRYRTGDLVRPIWDHAERYPFVKLDGGILGRADEMLVIRGVNVYPGSLEGLIREVEPTAEFRVCLSRSGAMDEVTIQLEASPEICRLLADRIAQRLLLRMHVIPVEFGSLPRFEGKAKRWVDQRASIVRQAF